MPYLKLDIASARQIGLDLRNNAESRQSDLAALGARANPSNVWEGEASQAYQEKYENWRRAETQLVEALRDLGMVVEKIVDNFDEINQRGAAALRQ